MLDVTQEFSTQAAPVAPFTWMVGPVTLLNTDKESGFIPVRFSRKMEVLGFFAEVIPVLPLAGGGLVSPTVADIDVLIELDQDVKYTSRVDEDGPDLSFVPLGSIVTTATRLMRIVPNAAAPDFQIKFAWRQFDVGVPHYEGAIIALAMFGRYLPKELQG